jgi:hypothetical protein
VPITAYKQRTKKPTPLSTLALAAYLTWKQHDVLCLLRDESPMTTADVSEGLDDIKTFDMTHGGAFYQGTNYGSAYSCLTTLEKRQLVSRHLHRGTLEWTTTKRARQALKGLGS